MRKLFIILSIIFTTVGIIFTVLPMGNIGLIPIGIAILCAVFSVIYSKEKNKKYPKWILVFSAILFLVVVGKEVFIKDKVAVDQQFNQKKEESKQQAQQELEELDVIN